MTNVFPFVCAISAIVVTFFSSFFLYCCRCTCNTPPSTWRAQCTGIPTRCGLAADFVRTERLWLRSGYRAATEKLVIAWTQTATFTQLVIVWGRDSHQTILDVPLWRTANTLATWSETWRLVVYFKSRCDRLTLAMFWRRTCKVSVVFIRSPQASHI